MYRDPPWLELDRTNAFPYSPPLPSPPPYWCPGGAMCFSSSEKACLAPQTENAAGVKALSAFLHLTCTHTPRYQLIETSTT